MLNFPHSISEIDPEKFKEIEIEYPLSGEENIAANITGAYLLGYDIIKINGKSTISVKDREVIRESMRRLVGMEILDEDASNITGQFLLDETSLNPGKIFKRMSSIALGMFVLYIFKPLPITVPGHSNIYILIVLVIATIIAYRNQSMKDYP